MFVTFLTVERRPDIKNFKKKIYFVLWFLEVQLMVMSSYTSRWQEQVVRISLLDRQEVGMGIGRGVANSNH